MNLGSDTILSRPKNGRDDTRLIPPIQVSLKLNYYNKNVENLLSTYIIPQNLQEASEKKRIYHKSPG